MGKTNSKIIPLEGGHQNWTKNIVLSSQNIRESVQKVTSILECKYLDKIAKTNGFSPQVIEMKKYLIVYSPKKVPPFIFHKAKKTTKFYIANEHPKHRAKEHYILKYPKWKIKRIGKLLFIQGQKHFEKDKIVLYTIFDIHLRPVFEFKKQILQDFPGHNRMALVNLRDFRLNDWISYSFIIETLGRIISIRNVNLPYNAEILVYFNPRNKKILLNKSSSLTKDSIYHVSHQSTCSNLPESQKSLDSQKFLEAFFELQKRKERLANYLKLYVKQKKTSIYFKKENSSFSYTILDPIIREKKTIMVSGVTEDRLFGQFLKKNEISASHKLEIEKVIYFQRGKKNYFGILTLYKSFAGVIFDFTQPIMEITKNQVENEQNFHQYSFYIAEIIKDQQTGWSLNQVACLELTKVSCSELCFEIDSHHKGNIFEFYFQNKRLFYVLSKSFNFILIDTFMIKGQETLKFLGVFENQMKFSLTNQFEYSHCFYKLKQIILDILSKTPNPLYNNFL